jgi:hypothetical protein
MTTHAYLFEAKSIQSFILSTNRLKEIVGASELVESLTGSLDEQAATSLLDDALEAIGKPDIYFSRRGGATFYAFSQDKEAIDDLATLWPLLVRQYAPDLEFTQASGKGGDDYFAFENTHKKLLANRNRPVARLPQAGPFIRRNRRTGEPACCFSHSKKLKEPEPIDIATSRKLDFSKAHQLAKRFDPQSTSANWPVLLTPEEGQEGKTFPFIGDNRTIALIHADGNGLGEALRKLQDHAKQHPEDYLELFSGFSRAVGIATQKAAQRATEETLSNHKQDGLYPARPIVLGGDDLTIIVRADLALEFTREFLLAFAEESLNELKPLREQEKFTFLPEQLTACAGIAYAKSSQPFYLLHGLAEGLCKQAKSKAKKINPVGLSALSFHRIITAMVDDYQDILERELTIPTGQTPTHHRQTLECYTLEKVQGLPNLKDLTDLRDLLGGKNMARGPTRQVLGLIGQDYQQAKRRYQRWRAIVEKDKLQAFDDLLGRLLGNKIRSDLPYGDAVAYGKTDSLSATPLGDVINLLAIQGE